MKGSLESLTTVVVKDAWQTPTTNMDMVRSEEGVQKRIAFRASIGRKSIPDGNLGEQMQRVVKDAANWPTPAVMDTTGGSYKTEWIDGRAVSYHNHKEENPVAYGAKLSDAVKHGQAAPANPSTDGSRQGLWPTITAHTPDMDSSGPNGHQGTYLAGAVKSWLTPKVPSGGSQTERTTAGGGLRKLEDQTQTQTGKLNPRWVETLMGLPVGWVMPSCASPVTIEPTNCDSSETESCLPQPSELFAF
jgi:hypothetical protein